jgi:hypothetical protein
MPFEFIQIPANGQGNAKEELNQLLRRGRIASVRRSLSLTVSIPPGHFAWSIRQAQGSKIFVIITCLIEFFRLLLSYFFIEL